MCSSKIKNDLHKFGVRIILSHKFETAATLLPTESVDSVVESVKPRVIVTHTIPLV